MEEHPDEESTLDEDDEESTLDPLQSSASASEEEQLSVSR
jgi:hypothetical protein